MAEADAGGVGEPVAPVVVAAGLVADGFGGGGFVTEDGPAVCVGLGVGGGATVGVGVAARGAGGSPPGTWVVGGGG